MATSGRTSLVELALDQQGYLTGEGVFRVDLNRKDVALRLLCHGMGIELKECVSIGDSKFDIEFLKSAGMGIAIDGAVQLGRITDRRGAKTGARNAQVEGAMAPGAAER